jgi:hypothetical protein
VAGARPAVHGHSTARALCTLWGTRGFCSTSDLICRVCRLQAAQQYGQPQATLVYAASWEETCLTASDFSNDCALRQFQTGVLPTWDINGIQATREVRLRLASCRLSWRTSSLPLSCRDICTAQSARVP